MIVVDDNTYNLHRQIDFLYPPRDGDPHITIIGCGGTGSFVTQMLATMGLTHLQVWDADVVEEHNIPNQAFLLEHIGMSKVDAMADIVKRKCGVDIEVKDEFFFDDSIIHHDGIVISAVDDIETRADIFKNLQTRSTNVSRFIDGRLGGEVYQVFNIDMLRKEDVEFYESTLFPKAEAERIACTAQAIIYIASAISADISRQVKETIVGGHLTRDSTIDHHMHLLTMNDHSMLY